MRETLTEQPVDLDFLNATRKAASAQVNPKQHEFAGSELAGILRDAERTIGPGEREALARLVTGEYARSPIKQGTGVGSAKVVDVLRTFDNFYVQENQIKAAESLTAEAHAISPRTVRTYRKWRSERDQAVQAQERKYRIPST